MKACDVQIGGEYTATINKEKVPVRITAEKSGGGWSAIKTATNKKVYISLAKLLEPLPVAAQTQVKEEGSPTVAEVVPVIAETNDGPQPKPTRTRKPKADVEPTLAKSSLIGSKTKVDSHPAVAGKCRIQRAIIVESGYGEIRGN